MVAFGALSGGIGAELSGGNFWQGAVTGGIVAGLNHAMHKMEQKTKKIYTEEGLKEYYAIVAGESSNNSDEAQGIGEVIFNRLDHKKKNLESGFVNNIGGKGQFDAVGESIYNEIMGMSIKDIKNIQSTHKYYLRINGATKAFKNWIGGKLGITNGAYFWNATWQKNRKNIGFNWKSYNRGIFIITAEYGQTTFFKYKDSNKKWP